MSPADFVFFLFLFDVHKLQIIILRTILSWTSNLYILIPSLTIDLQILDMVENFAPYRQI